MKNNLRTIFDESMGGKPRKQSRENEPASFVSDSLSFDRAFRTCRLRLVPWTYDARDIYYAWLILVVYSITGTTLFMTI